ncbi:MAG: hypothetical protein K9N55_09420 [Phycisphaerae bacterium]|nr:hypothetical protein [Phycisphaerae bacterium]
MISIKQLDALRDQARHETCPTVNVTHQVMALLCSNESAAVVLMQRPLAWFAAIASTVALSVAAIAILQYFAADYPLLEVANSISWAVQ